MAMQTTNNATAARQDQVFASLKHDFESSLSLCRDDLRDGLTSVGNKPGALDARVTGMHDALEARVTGMRSELVLEVTKNLEADLAKKSQVFAAPPPLPMSSGGASSSSASREPAWVAKKLFIKGWCSFGESNSEVDSATAEGIGNHVVQKIPEKFKNVIDKVSAPYFKNRQATIFLKEPVAPQMAWELCSAIRSAIEQHGLNFKVRKLICAMDNLLGRGRETVSWQNAAESFSRSATFRRPGFIWIGRRALCICVRAMASCMMWCWEGFRVGLGCGRGSRFALLFLPLISPHSVWPRAASDRNTKTSKFALVLGMSTRCRERTRRSLCRTLPFFILMSWQCKNQAASQTSAITMQTPWSSLLRVASHLP